MAMPKHIPLLLFAPRRCQQKTSCDSKMEHALFTQRCVGTCQSWTLPRKGFSCRQQAAAAAFPAIGPQNDSRPIFPATPKHAECWLHPSNSCPFFQEKEIDRNWFENVKLYQLPTVTPRQVSSAWCKCLISPRFFSWLTVWGVKPRINPHIFSGGRLEREVV